MTDERRFFRTDVRSERSGGKTFISGYSARFGVLADLGGFKERIDRRAFDRTLRSGADVICCFNHNDSALLGRQKNGTLELRTDSKGLCFRCEVLSDTQAGRDVLAYLKRGDVRECSFRFRCVRDDWTEETDSAGGRVPVRTLRDVDLFDVGPVTMPAYPDTSVSIDAAARARALWPAGVPAEIRSRIALIGVSDEEFQERARIIAKLAALE